MLNATFSFDKEGISFSVKGHAGAAPKGFDLICASASMLAYTAARFIRKMEAEGKLLEKPEILLKEGDSRIFLKPKVQNASECIEGLKVIEGGFELLSTSFPKYVSINKFDKPE